MRFRIALLLAAGIAIAAPIGLLPCALARQGHTAKSSTDPEPDPDHPTGRDAVRQIVQNQCVHNWKEHHNPAPCERVFLADPTTSDSGYAVLADQKGGARYLLVPTQTMAGTESSELLDPDAPNFFAEAWRARDLITRFVGHAVPRSAIALAVDKVQFRDQDQFSVHIECLRQDAFDSLHAAAENVLDVWSSITVAGSTYQAVRINAEGLDGANLWELLATLKPEVRRHMGDYTLVAAGMQFKSGPGFIVLTGTGPSGELLLDSGCSVAGRRRMIRLISSMATRELLSELAREFERATANRVIAEAAGGVDVAKRVQAGEAVDVVVLASGAIEKLVAEGKLLADSRVDLVKSGIAIAVRSGAPRPDISTEYAVKRAVLSAKSLSYSTGPSGVYLEKVFERWGILEEIRERIVIPPPGIPVAQLIAQGRAELGFQQHSELRNVADVEIVGALPLAIQSITIFSGGIATNSHNASGSRAVLAYMASPASADIKRRHGMQAP